VEGKEILSPLTWFNGVERRRNSHSSYSANRVEGEGVLLLAIFLLGKNRIGLERKIHSLVGLG